MHQNCCLHLGVDYLGETNPRKIRGARKMSDTLNNLAILMKDDSNKKSGNPRNQYFSGYVPILYIKLYKSQRIFDTVFADKECLEGYVASSVEKSFINLLSSFLNSLPQLNCLIRKNNTVSKYDK